MRRLILLRHAKSDWPAGTEDHARPLAKRGRKAAPVMGEYLAREGLLPDLVLVSSARRTRETWDIIAPKLAGVMPLPPPVEWHDGLYHASPEAILSIVGSVPATARCVLVVGHNPGLHDLACRSVGHGDRYAFVRLKQGLPTAGVVVLDFPVEDWSGLVSGDARLDRFVTPAMIGDDGDDA
jgi:phosphohistidine phosphatase